MKSKQKTVLVGLSGGVDSAVAALLLKKQGYKVIGAFMKCFSSNPGQSQLLGDCSSTIDKKEAQKIAAILNIPLKTLNFEKEYKKSVIDPMFKSYSLGLTPNPDSLCNKIVKFPLLWKEAEKLKADYIATGHYAKIKKTKQGYQLTTSRDKTKDQSFFLYELTQEDLSHTLFPIGESDLTKSEVRALAHKQKFPNHDKKGTSGICFVGKINMKEFLKQKIKPKPGRVKDPEGNIVGKHNGITYYTTGERIRENKDIKISPAYRNKTKSKLYVAKKIKPSNTLVIAPENHKSLKNNSFYIIKINWINKKPKFPLECKVRIRHLGQLIPAKITKKSNKVICKLKKPITGLAEGQSAVIYKASTVLGGGEIRFR